MFKLLKGFKIVALIALFTLLTTSVCFADDNTPKGKRTIFKAEEIKDFDELLKRAQKGENDLSHGKKDRIKTTAKLVNTDTNEEVNVETYETAQLLEVVADEEGRIIGEKYAVTSITVADVASGNRDSPKTWDKTKEVYAISTIYYLYETDTAGNIYYKMTRGTGLWSIGDSTYTISGRNVYLGQMGTVVGGILKKYEMPIQYPSSNTFSYYTPTSWPHQYMIGGGSMRITTNCTITRGGTSWNLSHTQTISS